MTRSKLEILALRQRHLNPALSVAYREPLKIVRGAGCYLYDEQQTPYLDLVNNVCHVGHCHPDVVRAGQTQMAALNTNTRYLHDTIVDYAEQLLQTMPSSLSVMFFTNSGTEANELALRLARNFTGGDQMVVVDHAYHGHSSSLIDISPYKFDGKGGRGKPDHVEVVPLPLSDVASKDTPKEAQKNSQENTPHAHQHDVEQAFARIHQRGKKAAAFIAESMMGCGGQVVPPKGYLQQAFETARAHGALAIADEVQVGFGRVGTHFWSFQAQDALPDIVTMGKPMGNGHPIGAVITTPEIANAFANGMEYFNTYAGNPVSCAIAKAVLTTIQNESLMHNAVQRHQQLVQGLQQLAQEYALIRDIRGAGLFLGVELVNDKQEPATDEASALVESLLKEKILLSTDGPNNNVLKIKPPMVISEADVNYFLTACEKHLRNTR